MKNRWTIFARHGLLSLAGAEGEAGETDPAGGDASQTAGEQQPGSTTTGADTSTGPAELGDAGKKAIDAMKAERNAARKEVADAKAEVERLKAAAEGREAEWKAEQDARLAADQRFNQRILNAEVKAAATGKLSDPADALKFLDLTQFEVNDDGDVDAAAIEAAISALIESKPYLAAESTTRFQGSADAGARNAAGVTQLTREQLASMTPDQIVEAQNKGQLNDLLGITTTK